MPGRIKTRQIAVALAANQSNMFRNFIFTRAHTPHPNRGRCCFVNYIVTLERVASRIGGESRLALLINNAGFGTKGLFWEADLASQERMHKLHVMATVRLTHAVLGNMVARDFGGIVNVASVSAFIRNAGSVSYGATKSWMAVFTEGLYLELKSARSNVTVQALCPGFTYSEFHDTMAVSRRHLAGPRFWMTAEAVVEASLDGLRRRKLFVIPGWRYRLLTMLLSRLPTAARLEVEALGGRVKLARMERAEHGTSERLIS
jgi:uncharacterized protein